MLEHRGVVQRVADGKVVVAMETAGCGSCGHGGSCGVGRMAAGRPATLLTLPADGDFRVGETVNIVMPERSLMMLSLLGYLLPAFALLLGAWFGASFGGSDGMTALGAIVGFLAALVIARIAGALLPDMLAPPQVIPLSSQFNVFQQELHHER